MLAVKHIANGKIQEQVQIILHTCLVSFVVWVILLTNQAPVSTAVLILSSALLYFYAIQKHAVNGQSHKTTESELWIKFLNLFLLIVLLCHANIAEILAICAFVPCIKICSLLRKK